VETIDLFTGSGQNEIGKIRRLKVNTNGAVILITVRPGGNTPKMESTCGECTHIEVGTGHYALREDWIIADEVRQPRVSTITVKRRKDGKSHHNTSKKQAALSY
jgi:hypothetical protein